MAYLAKDFLSLFVYFGQSPHQKELKTAYNDHNFFELVLSHSFVPAVIEEIMNRAFIFIGVYIIVLMINNIRNRDNNLSKLYNRHGLIFLTISSLWFGYLHIDGLSEIKYMWIHVASGLIFGMVYLYTKDIKMPIILHAVSNLLAVMSDYNAITTNIHSIIMLLMGCLFIFVTIYMIYDILRYEKEGYVYKKCYSPIYIYVSDNKEKSYILMFLFNRMKF
ncbi:CPBP family intramembrane glutamic endopeptidase [Staphylococcus xylosus]|uniref:CPBP family intramembrane glutamic endopeptidase n=1 Tax=Staphylococcus xylosus TaxID=1288 RepID=UPI0015FC84B6|nr:CPBP family intramembrane glutamic endopeptidase [Staphylococcus xylosus]